MAGVSLRLLVLKTPQLDAVRAFYQSLGIELTEERHDSGPVHYAGQIGDAVLEIYPLPGGTADATTRLGFVVGNLERLVGELETGTTRVIAWPQRTAWGVRAVVQDPDGRAVELYADSGRRD